MRAVVLSILASLALAAPAYATGNASCSVDDPNLVFNAEANVPYEMGRPFESLRSELELKVKGAPAALAKLEFGSSDLVHHWLDKDTGELRMLFYKEAGGHALELKLSATFDMDEPEAEGGYVLKVFGMGGGDGPAAFKGRALCGVD